MPCPRGTLRWTGARRKRGRAGYRNLDAAWTVAAAQVPTWQTIAVRIPSGAEGPVSFTITDAAHWNRFARSQLVVSGARGTIVRWEPYSDITRGQRWRGCAIWAHRRLGRLAGQMLAGLASAGAALLVWTGVSLAFRRFVRVRSSARGVALETPPMVRARASVPESVIQAEQN
jgi:hypothetical protein